MAIAERCLKMAKVPFVFSGSMMGGLADTFSPDDNMVFFPYYIIFNIIFMRNRRCDAASIDEFNNQKIFPLLQKLLQKDFFRFYKVCRYASFCSYLVFGFLLR
uniref:Uncharacterized protein n=1 Tax=Parascaris equorum TaxID=6256 RepID=A0A914R7N1_PAREQ